MSMSCSENRRVKHCFRATQLETMESYDLFFLALQFLESGVCSNLFRCAIERIIAQH